MKKQPIKLHNAWGHLRTVHRHRKEVMKNCFRAGIPLQGLLHDLSKYSPEEFINGCRYFQGSRSPHEGERDDYGYSLAWMHHKGRNKHHFEYWTDYNKVTRKMTPTKMPIKYVKEMFCDRMAASKIYMKDSYTDASPLGYFRKGNAASRMHPETAAIIEKLLVMLSEKGEDATFAYIRRMK
ncbi:MAG: catalase [Ruminococcus sp.]|nr:catalase [Ruminococcus sp.]